MLRYAVVLTVAAAVFGLGACGGKTPSTSQATGSGGPTPSGSQSGATTLQPPDLHSELLAVTDLPVGWSVDTTPTSNPSSVPPCFRNVKTDIKATGKAEAKFQGGSNGVPALQEVLAYLPNAQALQAMTTLGQRLGQCGPFSFSSGGHKYSGTVGALSFPALGDQSSAYQLNASTSVSGLNITLGEDLLVVRKGSTIAVLVYGGLGTPTVSTVQQFAQTAIAKVRPS